MVLSSLDIPGTNLARTLILHFGGQSLERRDLLHCLEFLKELNFYWIEKHQAVISGFPLSYVMSFT